MESRGRPSVRLVVVSDASGSVLVETAEVVPADVAPLPEQIMDATEVVRSRLRGLEVERVLVRQADRSPVARSADGPRIRLLMEGSLLGAARSVVADTTICDGKEAGRLFGSDKATLDAAGRGLATACGLDEGVYYEAAAAALAALAI